MKFHAPNNHPDFPNEKGKNLSHESKLLMTTVRQVVLSILDNRNYISLRSSGKKSHNISLEGILDKEFSTSQRKEFVKETIHNALKIVGVQSKKRIKNALETLGGQYKHMSDERFLHRIENGKVERDCKFLVGMMRYMGQLGEEGLPFSINNLLLDTNFQSLDKSDSRKALKYLIGKAKEVLGNKKNKSKISYQQFEEMLKELSLESKNKGMGED